MEGSAGKRMTDPADMSQFERIEEMLRYLVWRDESRGGPSLEQWKEQQEQAEMANEIRQLSNI